MSEPELSPFHDGSQSLPPSERARPGLSNPKNNMSCLSHLAPSSLCKPCNFRYLEPFL